MTKRRKDSDALEAILAGTPEAAPATTTRQAPVRKPKKEKLGTAVSSEVLERIRNASHWTRLPVAAIVDSALLAEAQRLEASHNHGRPFEERPGKLAPGRRV